MTWVDLNVCDFQLVDRARKSAETYFKSTSLLIILCVESIKYVIKMLM